MGLHGLWREKELIPEPPVFSRVPSLPEAVRNLEKQMIEEALARSGGNQRRASEILGITERMLAYRIKHYNLVIQKWKD